MLNNFRQCLFGLSAGLITSCGYFALFFAIGVITRFIQYSHTAGSERIYENAVILGVVFGNIFGLFYPVYIIPRVLLVIFFLFAGIFSGCFLMSLSEAVKGIPVFARRARLRTGFTVIIFFIALGKGLGSLFYFIS